MYSQSGGKGSTHAWLSDSTNIGAIFILSCRLMNMHIITISELYVNETLRYTWAHMFYFHLTDSFTRACLHPAHNTHTQPGQLNTDHS